MVALCVQTVAAASDANAHAEHAREVMKACSEVAKWLGLAL